MRNFNCEVHENDSYILGRFVDVKRSASSKKLVPIHNFCLEDDFLNREDLLEMLSSKAIQFISACLNNYQDGTIHFGIDPRSGSISGVNLTEEEAINSMSYYIEKAFPDENIKSIVNNTMRPPALMPVLNTDLRKTGKFVIEIDVVAASACIQNPIKTKLNCLKCLPKSAKKSRKVGYFFFDEQREPALIGFDKIEEFLEQVKIASKLRKDEEDMAFSASPENLRQKLLNLLTGGREKLEDVIYPFIVLSSLDAKMDKIYIKKNIQFIKNLETDVVFDFDSSGSSKGIYHCFDVLQGELTTVLTLDNFINTERNTESRKFIESIDTDKISWVFCNGYDTMSIKPLCPTDWNKQVRSAFHKAITHFAKLCSRDRIIIIICLFSKDYETMLEGCEEILTNFPNQWVVYAETESISELLKNEMIQRKKVDKKDALNRFICGLTWEQINDTIEQVTHHTDTLGCILPQAAGTLTKPIPEKKFKSWCDVELLSAADPEVNEEIRKKVMENFYKGESVEWVNFCFEGQVLKRADHDKLKTLTKNALKEEKDNISTVILFHHPGSGATTSAKNVLWELREEYRCCVIKKITDETCNQLMEIRQFSEPNQSPKPLLILIDNEDEEKYRQLKQNLELKCKFWNKENDNNSKVFFTMFFFN
ncbi:hypothetical protein Btru_055814 [Bulinus truncatus]|nr:hypothetical protein Btru_055814 [Bulinus truncatus]